MYAIIRTGGKQYKVQAGDVLRVEKIDQALGSEFVLTDVLMIGGDKSIVGNPLVKDAKVTLVVTRQAKDRKVIIFKKKRRQGYRKFQGHRQLFTEIFVKSIASPSGSVNADSEPVIVDMEARRKERLVQKQNKTSETVEAASEASTSRAATVRKVTKKKAAKKVAKKAPAKKATAAKKKATKKTTSKK